METDMVAMALQMFGNGTLKKARRRGKTRVRYDERVSYLSDNRVVMARKGDISLEGAFIETLNPDPVGTRAAIQIERAQEVLVLDVEVSRVSFLSDEAGIGVGMGLSFLHLTRPQRKSLAGFVVDCQDRGGASC